MKNAMQKIVAFLRMFFGYGIMICLFAGGSLFLGYLAALIIGGDVAALICQVIYKQIVPVLVYATTALVLLGLVIMYLSGELALTTRKK